jgi:hypothetical protein
MVVDPHVAEFECIDDAQCTADVTGPNRCRQAILDVVGECDRVGLVMELLNGGATGPKISSWTSSSRSARPLIMVGS